jgi:glycosyltransferase involved in cell wall biosynthesis
VFLNTKTTYLKKLTIIGGNDILVEIKLKELSILYPEKIEYLGFLLNTELVNHFGNADIGISWVPLTDFFDWQPPTKIIEYLMAGIPVIATNTSASKEVVDDSVGWLINDSDYEFANFLKTINVENIPDSKICREKVMHFTWEKVVNEHVVPFLYKVKK